MENSFHRQHHLIAQLANNSQSSNRGGESLNHAEQSANGGINSEKRRQVLWLASKNQLILATPTSIVEGRDSTSESMRATGTADPDVHVTTRHHEQTFRTLHNDAFFVRTGSARNVKVHVSSKNACRVIVD